MTETKPVDDRLKSIFDGYLSLQSESYEFITRTIAMHNWLREAYRLMQDNPRLNSDELYLAWNPAFKQVYEHLFAAFLRPYRSVVLPFGELMKMQTEHLTVSSVTNTNLSMFEMFSEAQAKFLRGFSGAVQDYSGEVSRFLHAEGGHTIDEFGKVSPLSLAKHIGDEEMKVFFESAGRFFGFLGESEFHLPKALILHLQKLFEIYPQIHELSEQYEGMLEHNWERALKRFTSEIKKEGPEVDFKQFFKSYVSVLTQEFDGLLRSEEFVGVQNRFLELTSEFTSSLRKAIEVRIEMFPYLPFVTTSEMEAVEKNVHSYKRRLDILERKMADMEEKAEMRLVGAELPA